MRAALVVQGQGTVGYTFGLILKVLQCVRCRKEELCYIDHYHVRLPKKKKKMIKMNLAEVFISCPLLSLHLKTS